MVGIGQHFLGFTIDVVQNKAIYHNWVGKKFFKIAVELDIDIFKIAQQLMQI